MKSVSCLVLGMVIGGTAAFVFLKEREPLHDPVRPIAESELSEPISDSREAVARTKERSQAPMIPSEIENSAVKEIHDDETSTQVVEPEFERLYAKNDQSSALRAEFMKQPHDAESAHVLEEQWRQYYSGNPETLQYGIPDISCRSKWCEIRLMTYRTVAFEDLYKIFASPNQNRQPKPLSVPSGGELREENGATALVFYFRKPVMETVR